MNLFKINDEGIIATLLNFLDTSLLLTLNSFDTFRTLSNIYDEAFLNPFVPNALSLYPPLMFSGGRERVH